MVQSCTRPVPPSTLIAKVGLPESSRRASAAGNGQRRFDGLVVHDVDDLHDLHARRGAPDFLVRSRRDRINQLEGVHPAAPQLFDDLSCIGLRRQQDRGDTGRNGVGDFCDSLFRNDPDAAGHLRDEPERRCAVSDRRRRLLSAGDAADLETGCSIRRLGCGGVGVRLVLAGLRRSGAPPPRGAT